MTFQSVAILVLNVIGSGGFAMIVTQLLKKESLDPSATAKVRAIAAVFSAAAVILTGLVDGQISQPDVGTFITAIVGSLAAWGVAHTSYEAVKDTPRS